MAARNPEGEVGRRRRSRATRGQALLWREIEARQILGCDFEQRHPLDRYTIDFYCAELRLAIEVGAILHDRRDLRREQRRTARIEQLGITVLRFSDEDVIHNLDGVIASLRRCVRMKAGRWAAAAGKPLSLPRARARPIGTARAARRPMPGRARTSYF